MLKGRTGLHHESDLLTPDVLTTLGNSLSPLQTDKSMSFNNPE